MAGLEWREALAECRTEPAPSPRNVKSALWRREGQLAGKKHYHFESDTLRILDAKLGVALSGIACSQQIPPAARKAHREKEAEITPISTLSSGHRIERAFNPEGTLSEIWLTHGGKREGQSLLLDAHGEIYGESYYSADQLHGPSRHFLPKGGLASEVWFFQGARQGVQRQYHHNKALYSLQGYRDDLAQGPHLTFYESGLCKSRLHYDRGQLTGLARLYHPDGSLARSVRFDQGVRAGWDRHWHANGYRAFQAHYAKGLVQNIAKRWHVGGQLAEVMRYLEPGGRVETRQFSQDGAKISEGIYLDATRYRARTWDTRGQLAEERELIWSDGSLVASKGAG